jgi:hypothetical protein
MMISPALPLLLWLALAVATIALLAIADELRLKQQAGHYTPGRWVAVLGGADVQHWHDPSWPPESPPLPPERFSQRECEVFAAMLVAQFLVALVVALLVGWAASWPSTQALTRLGFATYTPPPAHVWTTCERALVAADPGKRLAECYDPIPPDVTSYRVEPRRR